MKFGVLFTSHPHADLEPYPHRDVHARTTAEILEVDRLGYDTAWIAEHHFSNCYGILPDPFTYIGYLAAKTKQIKLGPAVMTLPLYNPVRVVENAGFADILSNGRFILGLGSGYRPYEFEGMGMPKILGAQYEEMLYSADIAFGLYVCLTSGASLAIDAHATQELKQKYLPKMYSGEWAGAMDLTEPHSGTDLGMIRTKAVDNGDGSYSVSGTKIFITGGEQDLSENIIHLVLAKLPDAPAGPKGISLFLVPRNKVDENNVVGENNNVTCGSIEHKMGIKASATCVMNFDGAQGWLVGDLNKGLNAMFTMMNYERLSVGIQGLGAAERSYQNAVAYAVDRIQGRAATGPVQPEKQADPIIVHPDVRRMLMTMRAYNEGGRAFSTYVASFLDTAKFSDDAEQKEYASNMVQLLTPVAKAYLTDRALECCIAGQQVFGGHGYIREWGQEQLVRDTRITQIYEGTNGIQSLDLMGRKIVGNGGKLFELFAADGE